MFWRRTNSPLRLSTKDGSRTTFGEWPLEVQIEGLDWLQNSPPFDAVAIDEKGGPVRIVAPGPRVWAVHKLWLSRRADRQPIKRHRAGRGSCRELSDPLAVRSRPTPHAPEGARRRRRAFVRQDRHVQKLLDSTKWIASRLFDT
jgi:Nucleotidyltransferase